MTLIERARQMIATESESNERWRDLARELVAEVEKSQPIATALDDACTLLDGWITNYCIPRYRSEHYRDVAKKRALVAAMQEPQP